MSNKNVVTVTLIVLTLFTLWGMYYPKDALTFLLVIIWSVVFMLIEENSNNIKKED